MLAIDSVKLVIMLRDAALSVTEPVAGFRSQVVVGSGRISCRASKSALSLHKTAPQPSHFPSFIIQCTYSYRTCAATIVICVGIKYTLCTVLYSMYRACSLGLSRIPAKVKPSTSNDISQQSACGDTLAIITES
jgi:hypothetical protein